GCRSRKRLGTPAKNRPRNWPKLATHSPIAMRPPRLSEANCDNLSRRAVQERVRSRAGRSARSESAAADQTADSAVIDPVAPAGTNAFRRLPPELSRAAKRHRLE